MRQVDACAITRLRVRVGDGNAIDEPGLRADGLPLMRIAPDLVHVIAGEDAAGIAQSMRESMAVMVVGAKQP